MERRNDMATTSTALVPLGGRDYIAKMTNQGTPDDLLALVTTHEAKALSDVALVTKVEAQGEVWHHVRTYINEWLVARFPVFDELAIRIADRKRKGMLPLIIKSQPCDSFKRAIRLILECDPSYYFKIRKKHLGGGWQKALPAQATAPDKAEVAETSLTDIKVGEPDAKDAEVCDPDPVPMPSDETVDKVHSAANETATEINVPETEVVKPAPSINDEAAKAKHYGWQTTKRGYNFFDVLSAFQKAIRRGNARLACYWAAELYESGFRSHVWNRLLIISAEDIWGTATQHIEALRQEVKVLESVDKHINTGKNGSDKKPFNVLFVLKAAYLLATALKNRDTDNFYCLVYKPAAIPENELLADLEASKDVNEPIPQEALDMHTAEGRRRLKALGWSKKQMKEQFILKETNSLSPRHDGEFSNLLDGVVNLEGK
jgi:hypothetical protein